jgi:hypothetical protein
MMVWWPKRVANNVNKKIVLLDYKQMHLLLSFKIQQSNSKSR